MKEHLDDGNEDRPDYDRLPELVTIFILSFDPFGAGAMFYEAGTIIKTHPDIPYNDGVRRIYLYTGGKISNGAGKHEQKMKNLLKYINESIEENVIDETTRRLDDIVKYTKRKKDIGVRYMKRWERERELIEEGRKEERANTEAEKARVDAEQRRADEAEVRAGEEKNRADKAEAELEKYRKMYGKVV